MSKCHVKLSDVELYYPSTLYNQKSLKQAVFEIILHKKRQELIHDVHALKGVTFEIHEGEKVGIIGANGAGKSTLLKAIAGLYPINSGGLSTKGKIRSLFDLALGFEVEATGRENIMYRALLLGETPKVIREKTNEIIEFADLGEFIDYPIKAYSAGMIVRLAFAISTMIDGDILLLDEIFGAGDANFMSKAKLRIMNMIENAKILIFVSHDFSAISELCQRVIWLDDGRVRMDGKPEEVIKAYLDNTL